MSREVIGTGTTVTEREHVPGPRHDVHLAAVTDLDVPATPEAVPTAPGDGGRPGSWRQGAPAWLWGPAGVVVAVVVGLLAGGLLGAGVAERSADDSVRLLGGLTYPQIGFSGVETGNVTMAMLVVNAGPDPVTVVDAAFVNDFTTSLDLREPFDVEPGEAVRADVQVSVDCDSLTGSGLLVTVETRDGRTRQVELAELDEGVATLGAADLAFVCQGTGQAPTLEVSAMTARGDGSISLSVRNTRDEPVDLTIEGPTGTTIVSEPPFPVTLDAQALEVLILALRIDDCRAVSIRPGAGSDLDLVVVDQGGQLYVDVAFIDPVLTAGWFARQVALACG